MTGDVLHLTFENIDIGLLKRISFTLYNIVVIYHIDILVLTIAQPSDKGNAVLKEYFFYRIHFTETLFVPNAFGGSVNYLVILYRI